jgi:hypothetical protein
MPSLKPEGWSKLLAHLRADQSERWQRGEPVRVEHYLGQYPDLGNNVETLLGLISSEVLRRLGSGERPSLEEYLQRFPRHADALCRLWAELGLGDAASGSGSREPNSTAPDNASAPLVPPAAKAVPYLPGLELYEQLGEGGMGVVYRARDVRLDQPRAVKLIRTGARAGEKAQDRFNREARAVARLDHPGVVRIYSLGEHERTLYICMELLGGGSLQARLRQGRLPVREAADLVRQLALAVQHAHDHRVLHRDLKPANVLLTADGVPKVSDFGLAKLLDTDDDLTETGAVLGTPTYMAPEQAEGRSAAVGERTDVWALGVLLYECLTGIPPFKGESRSHTLELVRTQRPVPPRQLRPEVPAELEAVCLRCLEKRPERRPASAAELAADLQDWLDGKPTRAGRARGPRRFLHVLLRPRFVALLAALLLVALGGGAWLLLPRPQTGGGPEPAPPAPAPPAPGVWHPLLTREPTALRWPDWGQNTHRLFQPGSQKLVVSSEELGLLALGRTAAPRYQLAIIMQQAPWVGNIGLFLGYRDSRVKDEPAQACQVIELSSEAHAEPGRLLRVGWRAITFVGRAERRRQLSMTLAVSTAFRVTPAEHRLGLTVGPGGLEAVTWDGNVLPELSAARAANPPGPAAYRGSFGVYVCNGSGVFRDGRYLFREEPR